MMSKEKKRNFLRSDKKKKTIAMIISASHLLAAIALIQAQQPQGNQSQVIDGGVKQVVGQSEQQQQQQQNCDQVYFGDERENNIACQCNVTHCDSLEFTWPRQANAYLRVVSDRGGARFKKDVIENNKNDKSSSDHSSANGDVDYLIDIQFDERAQQVVGFGGALTDTATGLIMMLDEPIRSRLLENYFGASGLDYNMGRIPIAGSDMSTRPYSYDDLPDGEEDLELEKFKLQKEDFEYKIPFIQRVNSIKSERNKEELKLVAASWSAPAWMKTNHNLVQGRLIGNSTSAPYYNAYARYMVKFLQEYELNHGIKMWAITPQNEPAQPSEIGPKKYNFNSVNFTPNEMLDYLANSLIPELLKANITSEKMKLFIWDDALGNITYYERALLKSSEIRDYITGTAIHWYDQQSGKVPYSSLYKVRQKIVPMNYSFISTEASYETAPKPGNWSRGEGYARDIIENLRAGSIGWIDWNLALKFSGGPTWVGNYLDSPILVNENLNSYYKNPMYYALGHVSRFIKPNSRILPTIVYRNTSDGESGLSEEPWQVVGPDDELAVVSGQLEDESELVRGFSSSTSRQIGFVALNRSKQQKRIKLRLGSQCSAKADEAPLELELSPQSITSLAFIC